MPVVMRRPPAAVPNNELSSTLPRDNQEAPGYTTRLRRWSQQQQSTISNINFRLCLPWIRHRLERRTVRLCILALVVCYWPVTTVTRSLGIRLLPHSLFKPAFRTNVPFPPASYQISVVVMNHNRPYLLKSTNLLPTLTNHPSVSRVLLLHSNPSTAFTSAELGENVNITKVHHVNAVAQNENMGLAIRFHYCSTEAVTDWVIIVDDDMEMDPAAISILVDAMIEDPHRIVGHYGRSYDQESFPERHGYDTRTIYGRVEVVLTKAMILERSVCSQFMKHMALVNDLVPDSKPMWNGEDIFVNLVANRYYDIVDDEYGNLALADLPVWDADTSAFPDDSVSGNMDRNRVWNVGLEAWEAAREKANKHAYYRGLLWYTAKERLAALPGIE